MIESSRPHHEARRPPDIRLARFLSICGIVSLAATSCGANDGNGASENHGVPPSAEPFAAYVEAFCGVARSCCAKAGLSTSVHADCEAEVVRQQGIDDWVAAGIVPREPQYSACISAYRQLASSCAYDAAFFEACDGDILLATKTEESQCSEGFECAGDQSACLTVVQDGVVVEEGSCRTVPEVGPGERCVIQSEASWDGVGSPPGTCAAGLRCEWDVEDPSLGTCATLGSQGERCISDDSECASGLACEFGSCEAARGVGETCGDGIGGCSGDLFCGADGTCQFRAITSKTCEGDYA